MNDKLDKYQKWLNIISDEVRGLTFSLDVWKQVTQIENSSSHFKEYGGHFQHWQNQNYTYRMIISLCKITDPKIKEKDDKNFIKLLSELKETSYISFERFLKTYDTVLPLEPEITFIKESNGIKMYDRSLCLKDAQESFEDITGYSYKETDFSNMLDADISEIENIFKSIKKIRHKKLAHLTTTTIKNIPTYNDIENQIKILQEIVNKYYLILFNANIAFHFYDLNVKTVFEEAWIKNN